MVAVFYTKKLMLISFILAYMGYYKPCFELILDYG